MKLAVGVATSGRKDVLSAMIGKLSRQTRLPDHLFLCPATDDDVDPDTVVSAPFPVTIVASQKGSSPQRNAIIAAATDMDGLIFFDDDFFPAQAFLAETEALLDSHADIVVATGVVIRDGILGPGLTIAEAEQALMTDQQPEAVLSPVYNAYGCNMIVRIQPVLANAILFDENLPAYAWQEDVDFCRRLQPYGRIVKASQLRGVHLGVKIGRTSGLRLGYSQIANPLYLFRKGSVSLTWALKLMGKNVLSNLSGALNPPPYIDRRGRLKGNGIAFLHLLKGSLDPRTINRL